MKKNGPWKIKSTKEKYKNPWISVHEDKVIGPDGKDGIFGVVEMLQGVYVLPIDSDGYIYLVEQFRYTIGSKSIEVAGGSIDNNETPLNAAKRELEEETGITAKAWISLGDIYPITTVVKTVSTIFLAYKLEFSKPKPEGTENLKLLRIAMNDAIKMVMEDKIKHGPSCVAILKASKCSK